MFPRRLKKGVRKAVPRILSHRRRLLFAVSAVAGVALPLAGLASTSAAVGVCRSDPLVKLSNGTQVRLWATISADATTVSNVAFTLHIPQGLTVTSVQPDTSAGSVPDTFTWFADQHAIDSSGNGQFSSTAVVTSTNPTALVTAYSSLVSGVEEAGNISTGVPGQNINNNFQLQPSQGNATCMGDITMTGALTGQLSVPNGINCVVSNLSVGNGVSLGNGSSLVATGLTDSKDLQAQNAASVQITNGAISGNLSLPASQNTVSSVTVGTSNGGGTVTVQQGGSLTAWGLTAAGGLQAQGNGSVRVVGGSFGGNVQLPTGSNSLQNVSAQGVQLQQGGYLTSSGLTVTQSGLQDQGAGSVQVNSGSIAGGVQLQQASGTLSSGVTVAGGLSVQQGGSLVASGVNVTSGGLQAQSGSSVQVTGGTIAGNDTLTGSSATLCGDTFTGTLQVQYTASSNTVTIGNPSSGCSANTVQGALQFQNNQGLGVVVGNTLGGIQSSGDKWKSLTATGDSF